LFFIAELEEVQEVQGIFTNTVVVVVGECAPTSNPTATHPCTPPGQINAGCGRVGKRGPMPILKNSRQDDLLS
jgi:hypothetical protein